MKHLMRHTIGSLLLVSVFCGTAALADSIFPIEDPPVDFEVVDAEPFDGNGDNGPYSTFNDALLGTEGECRSMAEFDISLFSVPPGEHIGYATLEVRITAIDIFGLGVNGETPEHVAVDGYVGDGVAELADFQAGDGNLLDTVPTPDPWVGQVLSFDVTSFVTELVAVQEPYVGLTVRAGTFGGLWVTEGAGYPKLTIGTVLDPSAVEHIDLPATQLLCRSVPNPFTASTRIEYSIPDESRSPVVLTIHDATGRLVRTLQHASGHSGIHSFYWDGTNEAGSAVSGGVYFYRLSWNGKNETQRMLLVR